MKSSDNQFMKSGDNQFVLRRRTVVVMMSRDCRLIPLPLALGILTSWVFGPTGLHIGAFRL
jgi:hypothetical protein